MNREQERILVKVQPNTVRPQNLKCQYHRMTNKNKQQPGSWSLEDKLCVLQRAEPKKRRCPSLLEPTRA